ncbi:ankyrin repeat and MYND domain-containing protein 2 isoform X2 [Oncorhynchus mykiss]|uniref:ankyrin repeat and MYND domain-containing protein 2 isoform X2 n=1 Tax=Oncorhynchus mykiss TaxID=8022 RepID=UPI001878465A|nr:ankyrin repeat and MYND domain-containing protein 2 isoform X2 [Oncorhynchus mykiss]
MGLLKGRDGDGFPQYQEKFIRDCIRKFPCCEAALLQQQVMSIATVEIGNDQTAFSVLTQALMGKMTFIDADFCTTCGERGAEKRCSLCNMVTYCGLICQRLHCPTHKICRGLQEKDTPRLREHCDEESDMVKETASFLAELRF